jgi:GT2 family glycosyltransferase/glycosyltransferase involved in cell wall biosynthesis
VPGQIFHLKKFKAELRRGNYVSIPFEVRVLHASGARSIWQRIRTLYKINKIIKKYSNIYDSISEIEQKVALKILGPQANDFFTLRFEGPLAPWINNIQISKAKACLPDLYNWHCFIKEKPLAPLVDIIIPVYGQRKETLSCIHSVLNSKNNTNYEIIVIDDRGGDEELSRDLAKLSEMNLITLHLNETNLGFVKSVNIGMDVHKERDVILLNSDTKVYNDWIDRIIKHATDDPVATVTPLSNSATICSYPHFCKDYDYDFDISDEKLDNLASSINLNGVEVPTGVGFCMFIKRKCLNQIGYLDAETFGRGYGEENDFCQRAIQHGWKNIAIGNVFVRHYGGSSFGIEKADLCAKAQIALDRLHPNYTRDVQEFISKDPMAIYRKILDLKRLGHFLPNEKKRALLITLDLGGGTDRHVNEIAAELRHEKIHPIILKCREGKMHFDKKIRASFPNLDGIDFRVERNFFQEVLNTLSIDFVHIHHLLGLVHESIDTLTDCLKKNKITYYVTIHDYCSICPRITLIDKTGKYCNEPTIDVCETCVRRSGSLVKIKSVSSWRRTWHDLLLHANGVIVPNEDVSERLRNYYSGINIMIRPHDIQFVKNKRFTGLKIKKIAVIGAIGPHKGSELLHSLAIHAIKQDSAIEFVVMGFTNINSKFKNLRNVTITGPYNDEDALNKLKSQNCDAALFLSVLPETFSYTLSLALQAGLHPIAFNLGAQGRRILDLDLGTVLDPMLMHEPASLFKAILNINARVEFDVESHSGYITFDRYYNQNY